MRRQRLTAAADALQSRRGVEATMIKRRKWKRDFAGHEIKVNGDQS